MAGDPYQRGFVERRADGLYAGLRPCGDATVHTVDVSALDDSPGLRPAFWSAKTSAPNGAVEAKLFSPNPRFVIASKSRAPSANTEAYGVVINKGQESEAFVSVEVATLKVGEVTFGSNAPVTRAKYDRMRDTDFGCMR